MLKDLAEDYILGSDGNIRAVVSLDIEYKQSRKATLSVWQPQFIKNEDRQMDLVCTQTILDQVRLDIHIRLPSAVTNGLSQEFRDAFGYPIGNATTGLEL
jgi:hypothetical protein